MYDYDILFVVQIRVYDYDRGLNDDFMGGTELDPSSMELDV